MRRGIFILLCLIFVMMSFVPTIYEQAIKGRVPKERYFLLEHNYNFDYNFYLSRIRQGMEGRLLVTEKYYNKPHNPSLIQAVYLYLGKLGGLAGLSPTAVYHLSRAVFGFGLLWAIFLYGRKYFKDKWGLMLYFLLAITSGSWPILVTAGSLPRFATYMGWWSVIDPLSRITTMPHILIGQILLVILLMGIRPENFKIKKTVVWGFVGLVSGIIFPPTLIIVYAYLMIVLVLELLHILSLKANFSERKKRTMQFISGKAVSAGLFFLLSAPSLIYMQKVFREQPWKALTLFDIEHRFIMPYGEYIGALGPVFLLGLLGLIFIIIRTEKKYFPAAQWIVTIGLLFLIFENVPQQSPLRFTEGLIHVPLAVLATYLITDIIKNRILKRLAAGGTILLGFLVMISMILWLSDQAYSKAEGTWAVPLGAQHVYPLGEFMDGIFYLRDNTDQMQVVLGMVSAGNYIPAYAGNYVYLGHANTPGEDRKEEIAEEFFRGEMAADKARNWLREERISYVFFGPQERETAGGGDLREKYDFLIPVYSNKQVAIYKTEFK